MSDELIKRLRSYTTASMECHMWGALRDVKSAADLIEQQSRDLAALREDIEAQIRIAGEEAARSDGLELALRKIAAIENQYDVGDWDEIEKAREIARAAIGKTKEAT